MQEVARLESLCRVLRRVADEEIMPRFRKGSASLKADGTLLTEADLAAQRALARLLPEIAPYPVLGEEMAEHEQQALWRAGRDGLWVVDPVDGTTNFAHGMPYFAVAAALMRDGRPVLGAIYAPVFDECFAAAAGGGAWLNGRRVRLEKTLPLAEAVAVVESKRLPKALAARIATRPPVHAVRNWGASTMDWCNMAAGRADVMLHGAQKLWDYAAGVLILLEAGGRVVAIETDDYWALDPWQRSVVAARDDALLAEWKRWVRAVDQLG